MHLSGHLTKYGGERRHLSTTNSSFLSHQTIWDHLRFNHKSISAVKIGFAFLISLSLESWQDYNSISKSRETTTSRL